MTKAPSTVAPTDFEWATQARHTVVPFANRQQLWIDKEAQALYFERTGRADPWPDAEDYTEAILRVSKADL